MSIAAAPPQTADSRGSLDTGSLTVDDLTLVSLAFIAALLVTALTSPVGVSGAVFLLPVQVSVLGVPSPAVTPTNLLFNVIATPGALIRYARQGQVDRLLAMPLVAGSLPGVIFGAWLRVMHLSGDGVLRALLAAFLTPLGVWLLVARQGRSSGRPDPPMAVLMALSAAVGVIGGLVGVGGGSMLAPILAILGVSLARVAPAALFVTFLTSVTGVLAFAILAATGAPAAAAEWTLGLALGAGGLVGGYVGARVQPFVPESVLRRGLGAVAVALGGAYAVSVLG